VATIGFPDPSLQGFSPKVLAHGHHGGNRHWEVELRPGDDPRYFQIRGGTGHWPVPSGDPPDGMATRFKYTVTIHSNPSLLPVSFGGSPNETGGSPVPPIAGERELRGQEQPALELPGIGAGVLADGHHAKLKSPNTADEKFEDVVKSAQDAAVLVLVY